MCLCATGVFRKQRKPCLALAHGWLHSMPKKWMAFQIAAGKPGSQDLATAPKTWVGAVVWKPQLPQSKSRSRQVVAKFFDK